MFEAGSKFEQVKSFSDNTSMNFGYCLKEEPGHRQDTGIFFAAAIRESNNGRKEKCYLKFFLLGNHDEIKEKKAKNLLKKENSFHFSYPYIETVRGLYSAVCGHKNLLVLDLEYIEGTTFDEVYDYWDGSVSRFLVDGTEGSNKELLERYDLYGRGNTPDAIRDKISDGRINVDISDRFLRMMFRHMVQLLKALDYFQKCTHSPYAHRDIKPLNIFLKRDGRALLFDFDNAHKGGEHTEHSLLPWSPGYFHPMVREVNGAGWYTEEQDLKIDMYSLGLTFFYMLFGIMHFKNKNNNYHTDDKTAFTMVFSPDEDPLSQDRSLIVEACLLENPKYDRFKKILQKMIAKDKGYLYACDVLSDLREYLEEYFGGAENCRDITEDECLLNGSGLSGDDEDLIQIHYQVFMDEEIYYWSTITESYGFTAEIEQLDHPCIALIWLKDRVEYVLMGENVSPVKDTGDCVITGKVQFKIKSERGKELVFTVERM